MKPAITVKDLYVSYHGAEALRNINFSLDQGMMAGVIGPNGAGKSTLLKAMLQLIPKIKATSVCSENRSNMYASKSPMFRSGMIWIGRSRSMCSTPSSSARILNSAFSDVRKNAIKTGHITVLKKSGWKHTPSARSVNCQAGSSSAFFSPGRSPKSRAVLS